jgi:hypothetical protein
MSESYHFEDMVILRLLMDLKSVETHFGAFFYFNVWGSVVGSQVI